MDSGIVTNDLKLGSDVCEDLCVLPVPHEWLDS